MGKRQRSTDGSSSPFCSGGGKRILNDQDNGITNLDVTNDSSIADEAEIVWGHSPPAFDFKLCSTPGPQTRRRSDLNSKEIAEMMEYLPNRNSSQEIVSSTPPLLGLWMQGRGEGNLTPLSTGRNPNHTTRHPRKNGNKLSPEDFIALTNELQRVSATVNTDDSYTHESPRLCSKLPASPSQLFVSPASDANSSRRAAVKDLSVNALWEDDSWYENDSFIKIATQLEAEALSQSPNVRASDIDQRKSLSPPVPQRHVIQSHNLKPCQDSNFKQASDSSKAFTKTAMKSQFTAPKMQPLYQSCKTQSRLHSEEEEKFSRTSPSAGHSVSAVKPTKTLKPPSSLHSHTRVTNAASFVNSKFHQGESNFNKNASTTRQIEKLAQAHQFVKPFKPSVNSAIANPQVGNAIKTTQFKPGISGQRKQGESLLTHGTCKAINEGTSFNKSSLQMKTVTPVPPEAFSAVPKSSPLRFYLGATGKIENDLEDNDLFSDSSLADDELIALVEKEEQEWEKLCSQQVQSKNMSSRPKLQEGFDQSKLQRGETEPSNMLQPKESNHSSVTSGNTKSRLTFKFSQSGMNNSQFGTRSDTKKCPLNAAVSSGQAVSDDVTGKATSFTKPSVSLYLNKTKTSSCVDNGQMLKTLERGCRHSFQLSNKQPTQLTSHGKLHNDGSSSFMGTKGMTQSSSTVPFPTVKHLPGSHCNTLLSSTLLSSTSSQSSSQFANSQFKNLSNSIQPTPSPVFSAKKIESDYPKNAKSHHPQFSKPMHTNSQSSQFCKTSGSSQFGKGRKEAHEVLVGKAKTNGGNNKVPLKASAMLNLQGSSHQRDSSCQSHFLQKKQGLPPCPSFMSKGVLRKDDRVLVPTGDRHVVVGSRETVKINTATESLSQETLRRTCSQEEIERKRQEALARKRLKEANLVKHHMSLRQPKAARPT